MSNKPAMDPKAIKRDSVVGAAARSIPDEVRQYANEHANFVLGNVNASDYGHYLTELITHLRIELINNRSRRSDEYQRTRRELDAFDEIIGKNHFEIQTNREEESGLMSQ